MNGAAKTRIGVVGLFGTGNYGNEATLTTILERLGADYHPTIISEGAARVRADRGLPALSLADPANASGPPLTRLRRTAGNRLRLLARAFTTVRRFDAVLVAGCGVFEPLGTGPFGAPFELWALALAARAYRRPFVILDVGAQWNDSTLARWFIRRTARWSSYRSLRDERSLSAMIRMRAAGRSDPVTADAALALRYSSDNAAETLPADRPVVVGVMSYYGQRDDPRTGTAAHEHYVSRMAELVHRLAGDGHPIVLVAGDDYDLGTAEEVRRRVGASVSIDRDGTAAGLLRLMASARVVVGIRYHTLIMGVVAGSPLVAIAYGEKQSSLLAMIGLPDRVRHVDEFDPEEVAGLVRTALDDGPVQRDRARQAIAAAARVLDDEWPTVDALLRNSTGRRRRPRGNA